jgi:hypothetical protein
MMEWISPAGSSADEVINDRTEDPGYRNPRLTRWQASANSSAWSALS